MLLCTKCIYLQNDELSEYLSTFEELIFDTNSPGANCVQTLYFKSGIFFARAIGARIRYLKLKLLALNGFKRF